MTISLTKQQVEHTNRIMDLLRENNLPVLDMSPTGSGKTITTGYIAKKMNFKRIAVICPSSTINSTIRKLKSVDIEPDMVMSYQKMRGVSKDHPHLVCGGLLARNDEFVINSETGETKKTTSFIPTEHFLKVLSDDPDNVKYWDYNVLFVFDEIQHLKNVNDTVLAARVIIDEVLKTDLSRVMVLSATPMDKDEQYINFFALIRFINNERLFRIVDEEVRLFNRQGESYGFKELYERCYSLNPEETSKILSSPNKITWNRVVPVCKALFHNVYKPKLASAIHEKELEVVVNKYYITDDLNIALAKEYIYNLQKLVGFSVQTFAEKPPPKTLALFAKLSEILERLERCKLAIFYNLAVKHLSKDQNRKVVIALNYIDNVYTLGELLAEYSPIIAEGTISRKIRDEGYQMFQENNNHHRLLICTVKTSGTGIDLHDTSPGGNHVRHVFASADYSYINIQQLLGRFRREGYTSEPHIKFVYIMTGKNEEDNLSESKLIASLSRKHRVMSRVIDIGYRVTDTDNEDQDLTIFQELYQVKKHFSLNLF